MSFGGMFDGAGSGVFSYDAGGGAGMHNNPRLLPSPPLPRPGGGGFGSSTGLSLGLQVDSIYVYVFLIRLG